MAYLIELTRRAERDLTHLFDGCRPPIQWRPLVQCAGAGDLYAGTIPAPPPPLLPSTLGLYAHSFLHVKPQTAIETVAMRLTTEAIQETIVDHVQ